jgi:hypothetical protein
MSGKYEDRESARGVKHARYRCIACHRPRSSMYYLMHPPEEPPPPQGMCRRCINRQQQNEHFPLFPVITIYEIHHCHHDCGCRVEKPCAGTGTPMELPLSLVCHELSAEESKGKSPSPHHLLEQVAPPLVKFWAKPSNQSRQ